MKYIFIVLLYSFAFCNNVFSYEEDNYLEEKKKFSKNKDKNKVKTVLKDFDIKEYKKVFEDDKKEVFSVTFDTSKNKKKLKDTSVAKLFFDKYLFSEYNQIFLKNNHLFSLYFGYDLTPEISSNSLDYVVNEGGISIFSDDVRFSVKRKSYDVALSYSLPTKFCGIHGRFSFTIFSLLIKQNIKNYYFNQGNVDLHWVYDEELGGYTRGGEGLIEGFLKQQVLGGEISQEVIFGHQNLYVTFGFGISGIFLMKSWTETNNQLYDDTFKTENPQIMWNNSKFNWLVKASLGHRFDFGMIIEINWKHYSNGEIFTPNWGFNYLGLTIGYAF